MLFEKEKREVGLLSYPVDFWPNDVTGRYRAGSGLDRDRGKKT